MIVHKRAGGRRANAGHQTHTIANDSDNADVLRLETFSSRRRVELDSLTLFERLVAVALNCREVHEHVVATFSRDEAEALVSVEKLNRTLCHYYSFLFTSDQRVRSVRGASVWQTPHDLRIVVFPLR